MALTCRKLSQLVRDDRVWQAKLTWLDYRGPGAIDWRQRLALESEPDQAESIPPPVEDRYRDNVEELKTSSPKARAVPGTEDDEFGDFFEGDKEDAGQDDGFGDFQASSADPFALADDFDDVAIGPLPTKTRRESQDLMMLFDDEARAVTLPQPKVNQSLASNTAARRQVKSAPAPWPPPSSIAARDALIEIFKTHHGLLLPYYLSLLQHTTSSLVFSSPTLTPITRSQVLASLVRFCQPLVAPTRSLPQRMTVLRNVQSATDFFESALLTEFERADTRRDEEAMKEKATVLAELKSSSVIQVFVQKREIFYDQSHNPLRNLV